MLSFYFIYGLLGLLLAVNSLLQTEKENIFLGIVSLIVYGIGWIILIDIIAFEIYGGYMFPFLH
jgi:hypothetical protein